MSESSAAVKRSKFTTCSRLQMTHLHYLAFRPSKSLVGKPERFAISICDQLTINIRRNTNIAK